METITLDRDIKVMYVQATSFPEGVMDAHQKLHAMVPRTGNRNFFGISRPENGQIRYKAAAEELDNGEAEQLGLGTLILKKGKYISQTITDYMKDISAVGKTFQRLLSNPNIDPQGYCVELYLRDDKDMQCMVRLQDN